MIVMQISSFNFVEQYTDDTKPQGAKTIYTDVFDPWLARHEYTIDSNIKAFHKAIQGKITQIRTDCSNKVWTRIDSISRQVSVFSLLDLQSCNSFFLIWH